MASPPMAVAKLLTERSHLRLKHLRIILMTAEVETGRIRIKNLRFSMESVCF
jgi:hypothetical protein